MKSYPHVSVRIEADSIPTWVQDEHVGPLVPSRLTTFVVTIPRFILAELNKHRMLPNSAQSSRAIPTKRRIQKIVNDPVTPILWLQNQSGMQAKDAQVEDIEECKRTWKYAAVNAAGFADSLGRLGLHKQWANRVLEPFDTITVIISGTDWINFFALRCAPNAQPEMQCLAWRMAELYFESTPQRTNLHLPFWNPTLDDPAYSDTDKMIICASRCARVSYLSHDGVRKTPAEELDFANRLLTDKHMVPFEHVARAANVPPEFLDNPQSRYTGCYYGWVSYRHSLPAHAQQMTVFDYEAEKAQRPDWTR